MRVLSRKVALRARESPPDIPLPLKSPLVKRGAQSGVGIPFPRDHSRRALFSLYGRHTGAPGNGPMGASGPTADRMHLRICRRGAQCAPAGRRGRRPLRLNRNVSAFRRGGCPHPPGLGWLNRRSGTPGPPAAVPGLWSCETPAFTRTAPQNTGTPPWGPRYPPPACPPAAPGATEGRRWAGSGGRCPR